jgi:hypothetical protein
VTRRNRNAELDALVVRADQEPAVLRPANAGDVEFGHHLDAGNQLVKLPGGNVCPEGEHPAVNPQPDPASFVVRFNVYVTCAPADCRREQPGQDVVRALLRYFDRFPCGTDVHQPVKRRVRSRNAYVRAQQSSCVPAEVVLGNRNELDVELPKHVHKKRPRLRVTRVDHG